MNRDGWEAMMRTMAVWIGAVLMAGGLWSASVISQGLADEPTTPSSASEATGGAAGKETGGAETGPPLVQGEPPFAPEDADVQERGLQPVQPGDTVRPRHVGPTDNLTAVANALRHKHKGLTTVITTTPGLVLTQPVEISISYSGTIGGDRITQPYYRKFGNRFVYHDPAWEGQPRRLLIHIYLTEPKPGGGLYSYSIGWKVDLDPIFDITVTPLSFKMVDGCDYGGGNSEIRFAWYPPDWGPGQDAHRFHFSIREGDSILIEQFAWARTEVSSNLYLRGPTMKFEEHDPPNPLSFSFPGWTWPPFPTLYLLPGKTQDFSFGLFSGQGYPLTGPQVIRGGGHTCLAKIDYKIIYTLRTYPNL